MEGVVHALIFLSLILGILIVSVIIVLVYLLLLLQRGVIIDDVICIVIIQVDDVDLVDVMALRVISCFWRHLRA